MEIISVDLFIVPEESKKAFLEQSVEVQNFLKTLSGFIEGFSYEKKEGSSNYNFLTTAVWKDQEAFENAGNAVRAKFQEQHFNRATFFQSLKVERIRSEYNRMPY